MFAKPRNIGVLNMISCYKCSSSMRKGLLILQLSGNFTNTALFPLKCLKCQVLIRHFEELRCWVTASISSTTWLEDFSLYNNIGSRNLYLAIKWQNCMIKLRLIRKKKNCLLHNSYTLQAVSKLRFSFSSHRIRLQFQCFLFYIDAM